MPSDIASTAPPDLTKSLAHAGRTASQSRKSTHILDCRFDVLSGQEIVEEVINAIRAGERGTICTVNVAILMMMRTDARLQRFLQASRWTVPDGQPLVWASHLGQQPLSERVTGIDLIDLLCQRAAQEGIGVYFLGAEYKTVRATAQVLELRHRGLDIRGCADGYFGTAQASARARAVAESGAQILFVAMGVPRQEYFIEEQWEELGARVVIGVGGSFDVIAGLRKRAPDFMQRAGLEWAYRLVQEPRRLFKRYLVTNLQFLGLMARPAALYLLRQRRALPRA